MRTSVTLPANISSTSNFSQTYSQNLSSTLPAYSAVPATALTSTFTHVSPSVVNTTPAFNDPSRSIMATNQNSFQQPQYQNGINYSLISQPPMYSPPIPPTATPTSAPTFPPTHVHSCQCQGLHQPGHPFNYFHGSTQAPLNSALVVYTPPPVSTPYPPPQNRYPALPQASLPPLTAPHTVYPSAPPPPSYVESGKHPDSLMGQY